MKKEAAKATPPALPKKQFWQLRLYIAGHTPRSLTALSNLKKICEENLDDYELEVVDLLKEPERAQGDQILAIPTLVRKLPAPVKRVIGDLSNTERVVAGLNMRKSREPAQ